VLLIETADNPRPIHKLCHQTQHPKQDHYLESPRARCTPASQADEPDTDRKPRVLPPIHVSHCRQREPVARQALLSKTRLSGSDLPWRGNIPFFAVQAPVDTADCVTAEVGYPSGKPCRPLLTRVLGCSTRTGSLS
jgi:hypothetical protein